MKKKLDSDWLRAVQFKCNTNANIQIVTLDYDWRRDNGKFCEPVISRETMNKILYENFENFFSNAKKMTSRKILVELPLGDFFLFILSVSNHAVFLVQF